MHGGHRPKAAPGETRQASSNEPAENAEWGEDSLDGSGKSALLAARNLLCSMHDIDVVVMVTSDKADFPLRLRRLQHILRIANPERTFDLLDGLAMDMDIPRIRAFFERLKSDLD